MLNALHLPCRSFVRSCLWNEKKCEFFKALHGRLKSQRDGTGGKLTVDPPFSFRRERGTGKI